MTDGERDAGAETNSQLILQNRTNRLRKCGKCFLFQVRCCAGKAGQRPLLGSRPSDGCEHGARDGGDVENWLCEMHEGPGAGKNMESPLHTKVTSNHCFLLSMSKIPC